jgi:hypothetical protein
VSTSCCVCNQVGCTVHGLLGDGTDKVSVHVSGDRGCSNARAACSQQRLSAPAKQRWVDAFHFESFSAEYPRASGSVRDNLRGAADLAREAFDQAVVGPAEAVHDLLHLIARSAVHRERVVSTASM